MTLEEAIKHCEEVAEELGMKADFETDNQTYAMSESERTELKECAKDHRQLAEWLKELKKRREQDVPDTNVGDTIYRQAAIDAIEFGITYAKAINKETGEFKELFQEGNEELRKAVDRVKALPSAQPEQRWTPCSERLPKKR